MKIKLLPLPIVAFLLNATFAQAQLYNNGATITVQNGASIMAMGDIKNVSGTITNDGKIETQGNFINTGTYTSTGAEDSLIMSGAGVDTLTGGGASINYLTINKTAATDMVRLGGTTVVNTKLDYINGILTTDPQLNPSYTLTSPVGATYAFAAGTEIIGSVKRTGWVNGTARVFNQPNMQVTTAAGTAPTDLTVTMLPQVNGSGDPTDIEREVKRKFVFAQTGGTGFTADVRFPYLSGELNTNTEANLVSWGRFTGEWNGKLASTRDVAADWVATTGLTQTEFINEWKLADPKYTFNATANLRGPWNGTTMNTTLNTAGIIPLAQPYNVTPFNYTGTETVAAIPNANVVDWVLVEHRKPATGLPADAASATITGRKAGFLLNSGIITELDGVTPIAFDIAKQGTAFITVRHRNHLGVLSNAIPSNAAGTFTNDYGVLANSYKAVGSPSDPVVLLAGGVKYGLWAGDANKSAVVNGTDVSAIKAAIAALATGYLLTDVNMSNTINGTDVSLSKATIAAIGTGSNPARAANGSTSPTIKKTNIPDPIVE
jgi:hypothetical protein